MKKLCWKGKAFKALSFGKSYKKAGRNFSGSITIFHRGGGAKRLLRRVDFHRKNAVRGFIERIEYDPNRTGRIALVRWLKNKENSLHVQEPFSTLEPLQNSIDCFFTPLVAKEKDSQERLTSFASHLFPLSSSSSKFAFSYILACKNVKRGDEVFNLNNQITSAFQGRYIDNVQQQSNSDQIKNESIFEKVPGTKPASLRKQSKNAYAHGSGQTNLGFEEQEPQISVFEGSIATYSNQTLINHSNDLQASLDQVYQKDGTSLPLNLIPLGSIIHNIELNPGEGGKLARAAGTFAHLVQKPIIGFDNSIDYSNSFNDDKETNKKPSSKTKCTIRLPSGQQQLLDLQCRATIGLVSNSEHSSQNLKKAGQTRWLGFRPVVRGVAMNPIDHPHGGGEGRTKGGRPSVSPWGKPTKGKRCHSNRKNNKSR